jgi:hypothetical protein
MRREKFSLPPEDNGSSPVTIKGGPSHEPVWQITSLQPGSDYAGAVVAESTDWKIQCLEWLR